MTLNKDEALAILKLYQEEFNFGAGQLAIDNINQNEDYVKLVSLVQNHNVSEDTNIGNENTKVLLHKSKQGLDKHSKLIKKKLRLLHEFSTGKRTVVGVDKTDYVKYFYKYENKKAKKATKLNKSIKQSTNKKLRQETLQLKQEAIAV